jgi:hypothetical protein
MNGDGNSWIMVGRQTQCKKRKELVLCEGKGNIWGQLVAVFRSNGWRCIYIRICEGIS